MRIVGIDERLDGLGLCFLCEQYISIGDPANVAINTGYEFDPDWQHNLVGSKYCCGSCARDLAGTVGWSSPATVHALRDRAELAEAKIDAIMENINQLKVTDAVSPFPMSYGN